MNEVWMEPCCDLKNATKWECYKTLWYNVLHFGYTIIHVIFLKVDLKSRHISPIYHHGVVWCYGDETPVCSRWSYISFTVTQQIFSCDQAALWMVQSVRPSVRLSVRPSVTPFWLCSHHRIIMKFSGVITSDKSDVHAKGQCQRSKVKVTVVTTPLNRFRTVTPVWIHIWWWNDAYSLIMLRRGALLFFKVIRQISRSHGSKNRRILPRLGVSGL